MRKKRVRDYNSETRRVLDHVVKSIVAIPSETSNKSKVLVVRLCIELGYVDKSAIYKIINSMREELSYKSVQDGKVRTLRIFSSSWKNTSTNHMDITYTRTSVKIPTGDMFAFTEVVHDEYNRLRNLEVARRKRKGGGKTKKSTSKSSKSTQTQIDFKSDNETNGDADNAGNLTDAQIGSAILATVNELQSQVQSLTRQLEAALKESERNKNNSFSYIEERNELRNLVGVKDQLVAEKDEKIRQLTVELGQRFNTSGSTYRNQEEVSQAFKNAAETKTS